MQSDGQKITITPRRMAKLLAVIAIFLLAVNVLFLVIRLTTSHSNLFGLTPLFDFEGEENIPTFFSSCLLLINAILFFLVWNLERKSQKLHWVWFMMSAIFIYMAFDELFMIHEALGYQMRLFFNLTGMMYYSWVIFFGVLVLALGGIFLLVWVKLEKQIRRLFVLTAVVYLAGAILLEMVGGDLAYTFGPRSLLYGIEYTLEESFEMAGLILCCYTLMSLIQLRGGVTAGIPPADHS